MLETIVVRENERDESRTNIELGEQWDKILHTNDLEMDEGIPSDMEIISYTLLKININFTNTNKNGW